MSQSPVIGIDLGTTYSCVGVFVNGKVEIIPNDEGNRTTPSYVAFTETQRLIGDAAKNQAALNPANTVFDFKRLLGRRFEDPTIQLRLKQWPFNVINEGGKPMVQVEYKGEMKSFFPEEISAMVLMKIRESAEAFLGKPVKGAVITVPACFNRSQRHAVEDAGKIAGLKVLRVISEPVATAIAYGIDKKAPGERNVLVFNLGGGTLDVSVLNIEDVIFEVKSLACDTHVGGEYFVDNMVLHFVAEFERMHKKDLSTSARAMNRLRAACEQAIRTLSSSTWAWVEIDALFEGTDFYTTITRQHFEQLNVCLFELIFETVQKSLRAANIDKAHIHEVVLVGGSSRIPVVQKLLRGFFAGKELNTGLNPDEAAAYGAAIQAAILSGQDHEAIQDVLTLDVAPLSLGLSIDGVMTPLLKCNTTIPTRTSRTFTIGAQNQGSALQVYEGDCDKIEDNNVLGRFDLTGIPPDADGLLKIKVTFDIDTNGALVPSAIDISTGANVQFTAKENGRLSKEDVERMAKEAEGQRELILVKNALESYVFCVKTTVDDEMMKTKLSGSDRQIILAKCAEIIRWLDNNQLAEKNAFECKKKELEIVCAPIIVKLYQG